jgi:hypothetical protein
MAKIMIESNGTFDNTKVTVDGKVIEGLGSLYFAARKPRDPSDPSVYMSAVVFVKDPNTGLTEEKNLVLAGKESDVETMIADMRGQSGVNKDILNYLTQMRKK